MRNFYQIGMWKMLVSDKKEIFSQEAQRQATILLDKWRWFFPQENSWAQKKFSVPSLIVRLDCVVHNGQISLFEVEERPAGIGVTAQLNPVFRRKLGEIKREWPNFKSLVSHQRSTSDDVLWLESISREQAIANDELLFIRAEPEEQEFHSLIERSISTLLIKGDKSYGEKMGFWKEVGWEDFDSFPWEDGFCLKPLKSSKCRGIEIWNPEFRKKKIGGTSTKTHIEKTLKFYGKMYLQDFIFPMVDPDEKKLAMAYRVFFGYKPSLGNYAFLGGLWNARPNLKIHGAQDTLMGPII